MDAGFAQDRQQRMARERVQSRWLEAYAPVKHLDPVLVLAALALTGIGLVAIYSAQLHALGSQGLPLTMYVSRQLIALVIGLVAMVVIAVIDYRHLRTYAPLLYIVSLLFLVLVLSPVGTVRGGAQRWIIIGGFQLQPSEIAKVALLVALAALLHEAKGNPSFGVLGASLALTAVPAGLVFIQPDLGTSIVFFWTAGVLLLIGGVRVRYLAGVGVAGIAAVIAAFQTGLIEDYQLRRLTAFLDAGDASMAQTAAFQTRQSLIAIGSGQFTGKGLFQGTQTSLSYVPENHTDFVFTVVGEEFGFIGSAVVLGLLLLVTWRGLRIAIMAKDMFGMLLAGGIVAIFALQVFINIGMTIGIMPVTGLPLPFLSYGGTSLIVWFGLIGLLLNIHMRRF